MNFLQGVKRFFFGSDEDEENENQPNAPQRQNERKPSAKKEKQTVVIAPLLLNAPENSGGVQGLGWFVDSQRIDEDGDVANGFYNEHQNFPGDIIRPVPRIQAQYMKRSLTTRKGQIIIL
uniref:Uncharacterized protein n=1 Tax=Polytomella parva TaxID=51329 RepID=A0A7S0YTP8_9CHLO|mmetsp:Transcript_9280/g.17388  ORF Transcript_9280/g.17388 Transcript_9280/m.17388 type:complete len:120 (+) Transcript_9280:105-464(+)|eukprot:CAMPEP_0175058244 /NCGR_PEP_ID=MMETSP0052_2-20121109/11740_1 /TAXON_ID=51329 ORGANISM="Polytomella parva, Strain SAG 63-3" /NCGR_SAMPLE_ID=MMETSP0052_2 /ASSEMBLY_ACC=CAM_ASM_000194 /LENGTH=119 /DNA_ID=CAMNT_0016323603 /DNA_START=108 /DNA_END=467 /DNA_ORIENTATION=+